jgi:hypothetical protein
VDSVEHSPTHQLTRLRDATVRSQTLVLGVRLWYNGYMASSKTNPSSTWGGPRQGAGAKPQLAVQLDKAEKLVKKLQAAVKDGGNTLALRYNELLSRAITVALDKSEHLGPNGNMVHVYDKDSVMMLKFLIELGFKLAPPIEEEDNPFAQALRDAGSK